MAKYKKIYTLRVLYIIFSFFILSCSSIELPSIEKSTESQKAYKAKFDDISLKIDQISNFPKIETDILLKLKQEPINKLLNLLAYNRIDDINLYFTPTKSFIEEKKSTLGISYTNYLNIDTGFVSINLKSLKFNSISANKIDALIELEGKGIISISGKYFGIPAAVKSDVTMYLIEPITFELNIGNPGFAVLKPIPKQIKLKTKFEIKLLEWKIPWYQEIPLELVQVVQPINFPLSINSEIQFPLPTDQSGAGQIQMVPYLLLLSKTKINGEANKISYQCNMDFKRK
ncbi:MAG: hypothetical protein NT007_03075 [Candidatus Kapabacteria bacterium]|nr:hypothetical protein [Candidatus Kapabacteria bacterium]